MVAAGTSATLLLAWAVLVNNRVSPIKASAFEVKEEAPPSLMNSNAYRLVVNPKRNMSFSDQRTMRIRLPVGKRSWSDEEILSEFMQGFFGGWTFYPELLALKVIRRQWVDFSGMST